MLDSPDTGACARRPAYAVYRQSVRQKTKSCYNIVMVPNRILVHLSRNEHRVLDPGEVYFLRASSGARFIHLYILCRMAMEFKCLDRLAFSLKVGSTTSTTG